MRRDVIFPSFSVRPPEVIGTVEVSDAPSASDREEENILYARIAVDRLFRHHTLSARDANGDVWPPQARLLLLVSVVVEAQARQALGLADDVRPPRDQQREDDVMRALIRYKGLAGLEEMFDKPPLGSEMSTNTQPAEEGK